MSEKNTVSPTTIVPYGLGLALVLCLAILSLLALAIMLSVINGSSLTTQVNIGLLIIFALVSSFVAAQRPTNVVGWLMAGGTLFLALHTLAAQYATYTVYTAPGRLPAGLAVAWVTTWAGGVGLSLAFVFALLLFPTGRLPATHWGWGAGIIGLLLFGYLGVQMFKPGPLAALPTIANPLGLQNARTIYPLLNTVATVGLIAALGAAVAAPLVRFRSATPIEQQQLKWVALAAIFMALRLVLALLPQTGVSLPSVVQPVWDDLAQTLTQWLRPVVGRVGLGQFALPTALQPVWVSLGEIIHVVTLAAFPLALGVAILRYRLWDIDLLINRSLVYGALLVSLGGLFGLAFTLLSFVVQGSVFIWAFGLTTLLAGVFFAPLYRWVQQLVDQHFYRIYIDYQPPAPTLPLAPAPPPAPAGPTFGEEYLASFGMYRALNLVGHGGMADVYQATHPHLGSRVALKILEPVMAASPELQQRFTREAKVLAKLQHPNIVRVLDYGQQDDALYIVMEYLVGQDLEVFLQEHKRLSLTQTIKIVRQVAGALAHAHEHGLVHRDIKPSNIMIMDDAQVTLRAVLTDFGIAKIITANTVATHADKILGTLAYIAPEQIQGVANIDGRADIYALGIVVYQMLTGALPFQQNTLQGLLIAHLHHPPPNVCDMVPELPSAVGLAVQRAMGKRPEDRYVSALDFAADLAQAVPMLEPVLA